MSAPVGRPAPITIVSSGIGNFGSVKNMLLRLGYESLITSDPEVVSSAEKMILPGVGAFDAGIDALRARGLDSAIVHAVSKGAQLFGICLGMQLLLDSSEEGKTKGLGLIAGRARKFVPNASAPRVPHMGWNVVKATRNSTLLDDSPKERRFYFVHSYFAECDDQNDICGITTYGMEFASAIQRENVMGVQFHLEKSHRFGMDMLKRYAEA